MSRFGFIWTVMLVLIITAGIAPFLLGGLGYGLAYVGNCINSAGNTLCAWAIWLRFVIIFGFGTLPAMFVALAVWAVAKSMLCKPRNTALETEPK